MSDLPSSEKPPGKRTLSLAALLLLGSGLFSLLHGLGAIDAAWLHPDPRTPRFVFALAGLFLGLGGLLAAAQLVRVPPRAVAIMGWSAVAIGLVVAHWLVFFAEGASCSVGGGGLVLDGLGFACRGAAAAVVLLFDLILLAALFGRRANSSAKR